MMDFFFKPSPSFHYAAEIMITLLYYARRYYYLFQFIIFRDATLFDFASQ